MAQTRRNSTSSGPITEPFLRLQGKSTSWSRSESDLDLLEVTATSTATTIPTSTSPTATMSPTSGPVSLPATPCGETFIKKKSSFRLSFRSWLNRRNSRASDVSSRADSCGSGCLSDLLDAQGHGTCSHEHKDKNRIKDAGKFWADIRQDRRARQRESDGTAFSKSSRASLLSLTGSEVGGSIKKVPKLSELCVKVLIRNVSTVFSVTLMEYNVLIGSISD